MKAIRIVMSLGFVLAVMVSIGQMTPPSAKDPADPKRARDEKVFHYLLDHHGAIQRTVRQLKNGVETLTESDNSAVAARIKEHVPAMYVRLKRNLPVRKADPLFAELFQQGRKIKAAVSVTQKGVKVVETSTDPYVVKLIKAHAAEVDDLVKRGFPAIMQNHNPPKK